MSTAPINPPKVRTQEEVAARVKALEAIIKFASDQKIISGSVILSSRKTCMIPARKMF